MENLSRSFAPGPFAANARHAARSSVSGAGAVVPVTPGLEPVPSMHSIYRVLSGKDAAVTLASSPRPPPAPPLSSARLELFPGKKWVAVLVGTLLATGLAGGFAPLGM